MLLLGFDNQQKRAKKKLINLCDVTALSMGQTLDEYPSYNVE